MPNPDTTVVYNQHPDDLIKTVDRTKPPTDAAPVEVSKEETEKQDKAWQELKKEIPSLLFGAKKKEEKPEDKKPDAAKPAGVKPEDKKPDAAVPEVKPTKVRKAPDALEIARETGKAIAENLRPAVAPELPVVNDVPADPTVGMSADDKETYELFQVLAEAKPERYKNTAAEFTTFLKKLSSYQRKWAKDHPDKSFDPADEEHEDFYAANQPEFDVADLDKARMRLESRREVRKAIEETKKQYEAKLTEVENKTVGPEIARQAAAQGDNAVGQFIAAIPDETMRKTISEDSEKLKESDPLAFDILNNEAAALRAQVSELHNIIHRPKYFNPDNPQHAALAQAVIQQEDAIKRLPAAQQKVDGQMFATRDEFANMTATQRKQYWVLGEAEVVEMLSHRATRNAFSVLEAERKRIETLAQKYGFVKGAASPATQTPTTVIPTSTTPAERRQAAPASPSGGALPPTGTPAAKPDDSINKKLVKSLF